MNVVRAVLYAVLVAACQSSARPAGADDRPTGSPRQEKSELPRDLATEPLVAIKIEGNEQIKSEKILALIKSQVGQVLDPVQVKVDVTILIDQRWFSNVEPRITRSAKGPVLVFRVTERAMVRSVSFAGNQWMTDAELKDIAAEAKVKPGALLDVERNREAAEKIQETYRDLGHPYAVVKLVRGASPDDRDVAFQINERRLVRITKISISGNKAIDESVLRSHLKVEAVNSWCAGRYSHNRIIKSVAALQSAYRDRGYIGARVNWNEKASADDSQVELEFEIDEDQPANIRHIVFRGNEAIDDATLRRGMRLQDNSRYIQQWVDADLEKILAEYTRAGYPFADAETHLEQHEPGELQLVFEIQERNQVPPPVVSGAAAAVRSSSPAAKSKRVDAPDLVDLDRLTFTGVRAFDVSDIRIALKRDFDTLLAGRSAGSAAACIETIQQQIQQAYVHCGFPDARVKAMARPARSDVEIRVEEGPRYLCGKVDVTGARNVPVQALIRSVTEDPKPYRILWKPREPAPFDAITRSLIHERLTEALADAGGILPRFEVEIVRNESARTATLNVMITKESVSAVLGAIHVSGAKRDSEKDVLKYLDLRSGAPCDGRLAAQIHRKLWESGRYLRARAFLNPTKKATAKKGQQVVNLQIHLEEYEHAPPLTKSLSPEEQALLKLRVWIEDWSQGKIQDDLALTFSSSAGISGESDAKCSCRMILAPNRGQTMACEVTGHGGERLVNAVFVADERQLVLGNLLRGTKLELPNSSQKHFWFEVLGEPVNGRSPDDKEQSRLNLGMQFRSRPRNDASAFKLKTYFSPAFLLSLTHFESSQSTIQNGICQVRYDGLKLRFHAGTGRLIECYWGREGDNLFQLHVQPEANALSAEIARLDQLLARTDSASAADSPWKSLLEFGLDGWLDALRDDRLRAEAESVRALRQLVGRWSPPAFSDLHGGLDVPTRDPQHQFLIPSKRVDFAFDEASFRDPATRKNFVGRVLLPLYRELVPQTGWWWPVGRDAALAWGENGRIPGDKLEEAVGSSAVGPLGETILALLATFADGDASEACGWAGLHRLSVKDFRRDYEPLLAQDSWLGRWLVSLAQALRTLDAAELSALGRLLSPYLGPEMVAQSIQELKADPTAPIEQVLPKVLDRLWIDLLRATISDHFRMSLTRSAAQRMQRNAQDADQVEPLTIPASATQAAPRK